MIQIKPEMAEIVGNLLQILGSFISTLGSATAMKQSQAEKESELDAARRELSRIQEIGRAQRRLREQARVRPVRSVRQSISLGSDTNVAAACESGTSLAVTTPTLRGGISTVSLTSWRCPVASPSSANSLTTAATPSPIVANLSRRSRLPSSISGFSSTPWDAKNASRYVRVLPPLSSSKRGYVASSRGVTGLAHSCLYLSPATNASWTVSVSRTVRV